MNAVSGHSLLWLKLFLHLPYNLFIFRSQVSQSLKGYLLSLWGELKTLQTLFVIGSRLEIRRRLCFCNSSKSFCCAQVPSCLVRMTIIHNQNDCNHVWGKGWTESEEPWAVDRYAVRKSCCNSETFAQQKCQVSSSLTLFCCLMGILSRCPHFQYLLYMVIEFYIFLQFFKILL